MEQTNTNTLKRGIYPMDKQELLNKKSELEKELGQVNKELWDYDVILIG